MNTAGEGFSAPEHQRFGSSPSPQPLRAMSPPMSPPPEERYHAHMAAAPGEQVYDAVPIPGANYAPNSQGQNQPGQAF